MRSFLAAIALSCAAVPVSADSGSSSRLLVAFKPGVDAEQRRRVLGELGLKEAEDLPLDSGAIAVVEPRRGLLRQTALEDLKAYAEIEAVEPDVYYPNWLLEAPQALWPSLEEARQRIQFTGAGVPADDPASLEIQWGVRRVRAPSVWRRGDGRSQGAGVRVAVLDTGIDCGHPDLDCDLAEGYNAVDSSKPPMDDQWHGTHVAGIIAARWDGKGMVGVAPQARLIAIKVLERDGGSAVSSIVKGIVWAANHDVKIVNMSIGAPVSSSIMHMAIIFARMKGVTFVVAAGNRGPNPNTVSYPGAYKEVISVAASGRNMDGSDSVAPTSSRGPQVSFIAPGVGILSCVPGGGYAYKSGTSTSAPHIAGLAALAAARGAAGPDGIVSVLRRAARPMGTFPREEQGVGLVDAEGLIPRAMVARND